MRKNIAYDNTFREQSWPRSLKLDSDAVNKTMKLAKNDLSSMEPVKYALGSVHVVLFINKMDNIVKLTWSVYTKCRPYSDLKNQICLQLTALHYVTSPFVILEWITIVKHLLNITQNWKQL